MLWFFLCCIIYLPKNRLDSIDIAVFMANIVEICSVLDEITYFISSFALFHNIGYCVNLCCVEKDHWKNKLPTHTNFILNFEVMILVMLRNCHTSKVMLISVLYLNSVIMSDHWMMEMNSYSSLNQVILKHQTNQSRSYENKLFNS